MNNLKVNNFQKNLMIFLQKYRLRWNNLELFCQALTHSTYTNENHGAVDYQRLEFLGDTILSFIVSEHLFKHYEVDEGKMSLQRSSLVNSKHLSKISLNLGLNKLIRLGKSIKNVENNPKILADIFEAFIAALFLDQGLNTVRSFLNKVLLKGTFNVDNEDLKNAKTLLQEHLQSTSRKNIEYQSKRLGQEFLAKVLYDNLVLGEGVGKTKRLAEVAAAQNALTKLNNSNHQNSRFQNTNNKKNHQFKFKSKKPQSKIK